MRRSGRVLQFLLLAAAEQYAEGMIARSNIALSTGLTMEWLSCRKQISVSSLSPPPVLFVHGTFHGAWCYEAHWMEHFAAAGIDCHAISLRGTSGSPSDQKSVKISEHVADLQSFIRQVFCESGRPPILVGHSFGGASVLKYLEAGGIASAAALVCAVPPSGNGPMTLRFVQRDFWQAWAILRGFAFKTATRSVAEARALFFDESSSEADVARYMPRLKADSKVGLNLADFSRNLPIGAAGTDGHAAWHDASSVPTLVLGAARDYVVDREGVLEMATFLDCEAEFVDLPHDVMLCKGWQIAADRIIDWVRTV